MCIFGPLQPHVHSSDTFVVNSEFLASTCKLTQYSISHAIYMVLRTAPVIFNGNESIFLCVFFTHSDPIYEAK